jgi:hypothetical protein
MPTLAEDVRRLTPYFKQKPTHPYPWYNPDKLVPSDFPGHTAHFEDSQADPYSFGGSPGGFTVNSPSTTEVKSDSVRHHLEIAQAGYASDNAYVQWSDATGVNDFYIAMAVKGKSVASATYVAEIRWWGVASPGASDKYYGLRFRTPGTGVHVSLESSFVYGTGVTFSLADGTVGVWFAHEAGELDLYRCRAFATTTGQAILYSLDLAKIVSKWDRGANPATYPEIIKCIRVLTATSITANLYIDYLGVTYP